METFRLISQHAYLQISLTERGFEVEITLLEIIPRRFPHMRIYSFSLS